MENWYLIQTKQQKERTADENLRRQQISTLFPLDQIPLSRRRLSCKPYFPGYLFAYFSLESISRVRNTRGVLRVVEFEPGKPYPVDRVVIDEIASRMNPQGIMILDQPVAASGYKPDDKVMITNGPLSGLAGIFKRDADGGERVFLLLKMFGREFEQPVPLRDTRKPLLSELAYV